MKSRWEHLSFGDGEIGVEVTGELETYWLWPAEILEALLQTSINEMHGDEKGLDRFPNSTYTLFMES